MRCAGVFDITQSDQSTLYFWGKPQAGTHASTRSDRPLPSAGRCGKSDCDGGAQRVIPEQYKVQRRRRGCLAVGQVFGLQGLPRLGTPY